MPRKTKVSVVQPRLISLLTVFISFEEEKGDSHLLCEAPEGPFRQKVAVTFFRESRNTT
jgi:hypothetical protein